MDKTSLIYGLVSLASGSVLTGVLIINPTQAQPRVLGQNLHPLKEFLTADNFDMGMMRGQQADRHFIQMMIPHHQGAVDMANLALSNAKHPEVKKLAEAIARNQNREIEQMKAWYKQWYGSEVSALSAPGRRMHIHSGMGIMGMMDTDLETLKNAADFDRAFLEQMIPHHKMAVMMAAMILDSDRSELRDLAKAIIQTQSAEIEQMRKWYQSWYQ